MHLTNNMRSNSQFQKSFEILVFWPTKFQVNLNPDTTTACNLLRLRIFPWNQTSSFLFRLINRASLPPTCCGELSSQFLTGFCFPCFCKVLVFYSIFLGSALQPLGLGFMRLCRSDALAFCGVGLRQYRFIIALFIYGGGVVSHGWIYHFLGVVRSCRFLEAMWPSLAR